MTQPLPPSRCGETIAAIHYAERITCYCPREQTGGKVLAGFAGGTPLRTPFAVAKQDRDWGEVSAGLSYRTGNATLSLSADTTFERSDVRNQAYRGGLKLSF